MSIYLHVIDVNLWQQWTDRRTWNMISDLLWSGSFSFHATITTFKSPHATSSASGGMLSCGIIFRCIESCDFGFSPPSTACITSDLAMCWRPLHRICGSNHDATNISPSAHADATTDVESIFGKQEWIDMEHMSYLLLQVLHNLLEVWNNWSTQ